ncbi:MAG: NTP transferase domain-containing protein [Gemmatimonadales bacterium]
MLGLIPARGGSKGVPNKNLRPLAGRPIMAYAIEAAAASGVIDRVVVSTDSPALADLGRALGAEVPFLRPAELATDEAPMLPVIQHAVRELEAAGWPVATVVLLQPTSPLRTGDDLRRAIELLERTEADSVVSVQPAPRHLSPDFVFRVEGDRLEWFLPGNERVTRRQDARTAYFRDGTVYCTRRDVIMDGSIYGQHCVPLLMPAGSGVTIDTEDDWVEAERLLVKRRTAR